MEESIIWILLRWAARVLNSRKNLYSYLEKCLKMSETWRKIIYKHVFFFCLKVEESSFCSMFLLPKWDLILDFLPSKLPIEKWRKIIKKSNCYKRSSWMVLANELKFVKMFVLITCISVQISLKANCRSHHFFSNEKQDWYLYILTKRFFFECSNFFNIIMYRKYMRSNNSIYQLRIFGKWSGTRRAERVEVATLLQAISKSKPNVNITFLTKWHCRLFLKDTAKTLR